MSFHATNFTVSVLLLMALTVFMAVVRTRKPLDNNWLLFYWILVTFVAISNPAELFDFRIILIGLIAGLLLRFEFMNRMFTRLAMILEMFVFAYVLVCGWGIVTTF
jgi:hypothetical protein